MKIGIDIRPLMDARYSGVSEYVYQLIKEIIKLDSSSGPERTNNEYSLFYNCFGECRHLPKFDAKNVRLIKYNYPNKILNYLLFKILNWPKVDERLGVDLFFLPHLNFIGLAKGGRHLLTVHDLSFLRYPEFFSFRKNIWHRAINAKKLLKKFKWIVAVSENTKRDIVELGGLPPEKVKVIYSGVGEEYRKFNSFEPDGLNSQEEKIKEVKNKYGLPDKFILYLGTIEPRKNIEGIIAAYNELRHASSGQIGGLSGYKLVIAGGDGWKYKKAYNKWRQSKFKDDIKFLGYIDSLDKPCLYNLASVFIYPSFYEGFGLPVLEAMACGLPVVCGQSSSLPEVAAGAAVMVDPHNIKSISSALTEILTDEKLRNELSARGLEQAKKFSWEKTAREYLDLMEKSES